MDFRQIDRLCLSDLNHFFYYFCWRVAKELNIEPNLDDNWDEEIGSKLSCFFYLKRKLPTCKLYLPMSHHEKSRASNYMPYSPKRILTVVGCFGLQLAISCVFWDHYISEYHDLLEVHSPHINPHDQSEVLRSSLMWIIMWFWRVSNAHSLMHFFLFFVFTDHMWDFLLWIQYIGLANIAVLVAFTELHLRSVSHRNAFEPRLS